MSVFFRHFWPSLSLSGTKSSAKVFSATSWHIFKSLHFEIKFKCIHPHVCMCGGVYGRVIGRLNRFPHQGFLVRREARHKPGLKTRHPRTDKSFHEINGHLADVEISEFNVHKRGKPTGCL